MTRRRRDKTSSKRPPASEAPEPRPTSPAFILVAAVTAVLPVIARYVGTHGSGGGFDDVQGLVWFGLVIVGAFSAALIEAVRRRELAIPRTGMLVGAGLLLLGAIVSAFGAENRYSALVGATQVGLGVLYFLSVLIVARGRGRVRLLLAALVAGAVAAAVLSLASRVMTPPEELMKYFHEHRLDILRQRGITPDSPEEELYRVRIQEDFTGTIFHPNLMASYMALGLLLTVGLLMGHLRGAAASADAPQPGGPADGAASRSAAPTPWTSENVAGCIALLVGVAVMVAVLLMTASRAAQGACVAGLYVMLILGLVRRRRWRVWLLAGPAAAVAVLLTLAFQNHWFDEQLSSLRHRWDYWQGTWGVIDGHAVLGVGPGNFGGHYLAHKLPTAPEDVSHPHNVFLWAWAELGLVGLAGLAALAVYGFREAFRRTAPPDERPLGESELTAPLIWTAVVVALLLVVFQLASADGVDLMSMLMDALLAVGAASCLCVVLFAVAVMGREEIPAMGSEARRWIRLGLIGASLAFWLQGQVSMGVPYLPTTAAALCLLALLLTTGHRVGNFRWNLGTPGRRATVAVVVLFVLVVYGAFVAYPLVSSNWALADAPGAAGMSEAYRGRIAFAAAKCPSWDEPYARLAESSWYRAESLREAACRFRDEASQAGESTPRGKQLLQAAEESKKQAAAACRQALDDLREARRRNPRDLGYLTKAVQICAVMADFLGAVEACSEALGYQEQLVEIHPTKASFHADYAAMLRAAGRTADARREAREALELDRLMPDQRWKLDDARRTSCLALAGPPGR